MQWYSVKQFLPAKGSGYVIVRTLNADYCQFVYQAMYVKGGWEFWDEEYWPEGRAKKEGMEVTHWTHMPELGDGGF